MNSEKNKPRKLADRLAWKKFAQSGELDFHKTNQWRQTESFMIDTGRLFEYFGFEPEQFRDLTLMDLGAGSRLRTLWFRGARIVAVEPLADQFRREIPWCDLDKASEIYSAPGEKFLKALENSIDAIISINVLDHGYDLSATITNIYRYLKKGGAAFLSFDSHDEINLMHPLYLDQQSCSEIFRRVGFTIEKITQGLGNAENYGHGVAINFWLRK
jgi:SAM-dependent methyltransferase